MISIDGYNREDIIKLLTRISQETEENRNKAMILYDHMEKAMLGNKGDLIILSQMADKYLEQASRQTEMLVHLAQVMQKLNQVDGEKNLTDRKGLESDINQILKKFEEGNVSPFIRKEKGKLVVTKEEPPTVIEQPEQATVPKQLEVPKSDIELESDL